MITRYVQHLGAKMAQLIPLKWITVADWSDLEGVDLPQDLWKLLED